ncbi:hypothetical protein [Vulgatibacter incomptus]|uniref:Uncharacterized protein n=1 Tax=Vulgatibacter incomptus TaxID=1391653 RepID=A0A0K1P837_9BACT|nr:hypothetical protein [Vulgatibacter incomptus]AKU89685.1 hypothetical protein AKJ08_0072 [Vulgatibacter incomptus]
MGFKERRTDAEATLRAARSAAVDGRAPPPRALESDGYAFLLADVDLQVSILGRPIGPVELSMSELRGKLQACAGAPPYRTEAASEAYTYPLLLCGFDGQVTEAYLFAGSDGPMLGGDEAKRPDWPRVIAALEAALSRIDAVDYEDKVYDPDAEAWIYYGVRGGESFEEAVEGEDPPEWAD